MVNEGTNYSRRKRNAVPWVEWGAVRPMKGTWRKREGVSFKWERLWWKVRGDCLNGGR